MDIKYEVQHDDLGRPDLISYKIYGTVKYASLVLEYNGLYDPFTDLKIGTTIWLPKSPNKYSSKL
jgi:hypothetical protein